MQSTHGRRLPDALAMNQVPDTQLPIYRTASTSSPFLHLLVILLSTLDSGAQLP